MEKFALRSQLQVDASPRLKHQLKQLALEKNQSLKALVLLALADKYPPVRAICQKRFRRSV
jgi:hypothetical protein